MPQIKCATWTYHVLPIGQSILLLVLCIEGIPNDGTPIEDVVTVSLGLTVLYVILATAGIAFSVVCILFNLIFRQKRLANSSIALT